MSEADKPSEQEVTLTFWDHLDELRAVLIRILVITAIAAVAAFCLKEELFAVVLAPRSSDFITYRVMGVEPFCINLMNTGLTEQFMIHLRTALYAGVLVALPYILYQLFRFVSPALYDHERRYATLLVGSGYMMFMMGTLLNYLLIFPLTVKFLGTYQVSPDVANMLTIQSYIDTLLMMNFVMGIVFELPVVCWLLGKMGLVTAQIMSQWRRHAVVVILIVAAIITPTTDAFTLFLVALPIWLLYEMSIWIVRITN
ncbi:MAG: twin-arginine translocase subunit TatC [Prevotella sp.]|jgi:sec-independent protein translocase protein TatC|nr:twin-arginine translocase subunit TatC [Prevotella sp.]